MVKRLFVRKDLNKYGIYCVWLNIGGEWTTVILDDYFPCKDYGPVFSSGKNYELWIMLIEKAYAKVFGSY